MNASNPFGPLDVAELVADLSAYHRVPRDVIVEALQVALSNDPLELARYGLRPETVWAEVLDAVQACRAPGHGASERAEAAAPEVEFVAASGEAGELLADAAETPEGEDRPTPPWPKPESGTATYEEVRAWHLGDALWCAARSVPLVGDRTELGMLRWHYNASRVQHGHDVAFLLAELHKLNPAGAEYAAHQVWLASEAGDSYGEWLWQWATDAGLDAEAIDAHARQSKAEDS